MFVDEKGEKSKTGRERLQTEAGLISERGGRKEGWVGRAADRGAAPSLGQPSGEPQSNDCPSEEATTGQKAQLYYLLSSVTH